MKNRFDAHVLDGYIVVGEIGVGEMASVLLASKNRDGNFRSWTAIKHIHPHFADQSEFIYLFLDEAHAVSLVSHENLAQLFDVGKDDGTSWVAIGIGAWRAAARGGAGGRKGRARMGFAIVARVVSDA
ncbi:MAG: hypothetical protein MUF34_02980 [Polyangiaceae bacterium]|jgi:serine/threonine-protein kinase|nr:hypothetical protein [Polyangiaceae bacterium]